MLRSYFTLLVRWQLKLSKITELSNTVSNSGIIFILWSSQFIKPFSTGKPEKINFWDSNNSANFNREPQVQSLSTWILFESLSNILLKTYWWRQLIYLFIYLVIYLFIYSFIHLFIHLFTLCLSLTNCKGDTKMIILAI